jgi:hypothetical protein
LHQLRDEVREAIPHNFHSNRMLLFKRSVDERVALKGIYSRELSNLLAGSNRSETQDCSETEEESDTEIENATSKTTDFYKPLLKRDHVNLKFSTQSEQVYFNHQRRRESKLDAKIKLLYQQVASKQSEDSQKLCDTIQAHAQTQTVSP